MTDFPVPGPPGASRRLEAAMVRARKWTSPLVVRADDVDHRRDQGAFGLLRVYRGRGSFASGGRRDALIKLLGPLPLDRDQMTGWRSFFRDIRSTRRYLGYNVPRVYIPSYSVYNRKRPLGHAPNAPSKVRGSRRVAAPLSAL